MLALDLHRQVEERTRDLRQLGLWEVDEEREDGFCQIDKLLDQALVFVDGGELVGGLFFGADRVISLIFWCRELLLDHFFEHLDSSTGLLVLNRCISSLHFLG